MHTCARYTGSARVALEFVRLIERSVSSIASWLPHPGCRGRPGSSFLVIAWLFAGSGGAADAQVASAVGTLSSDGQRVVDAVRIDSRPPEIDGRLDEAVWSLAQPASDFVQARPVTGAQSTQRTEARVLYDGVAIYVGLRMFEGRPELISSQLARRDAIPTNRSDWIHVGIDSYFDRRSAFGFTINPSGVQRDMFFYGDNRFDLGWDGVWASATSVDSLGWTAEIRIPLSQLRFNRTEGEQVWGVNFRRFIARVNEESFWAPTPPGSGRVVSMYGELHGIRGLEPPRQIEVLPYTVGRVTRAPLQEGNPFYRSNDPFGSAGVDLKFGITPNVTLTATVNPDFGQVEADPSEFNLTVFETWVSERRPFFMEGIDLFQFNNLVYSRRIGRTPQGSASVPHGHAKLPAATSIMGAGKLSGRSAGGWSIGVLSALTERENAATIDSTGTSGRIPVEPLTAYSVVAVRKEFRQGRTVLHSVGTATNRGIEEAENLTFLRSSAYTGGVSFRHAFASDTYALDASLLGSHIAGSPRAITLAQRSPLRYLHRPDASHLTYDPASTEMAGASGNLSLRKTSGRLHAGVSSGFTSPGYDVTDLGFQWQADRVTSDVWVNFNRYERGRRFQNWTIGGSTWAEWTTGRERVSTNAGVNGRFLLNSQWGAWMNLQRRMETLSVSELRGGPALTLPARTALYADFFTDARRPVQGSVWMNLTRIDGSGDRVTAVEPRITVQLNQAQVTVGPSIRWGTNALQYVGAREALGETRYILGTIDQRTVSLTTRLNYIFTPKVSLQFYAQPYVSTGEYSEFKLITDPRGVRYSDRFRPLGGPGLHYDELRRTYRADLNGNGSPDLSFPNRDFTFAEIRSNAVLRWEYRPGSTLFLVWSQARTDHASEGGLDLKEDSQRLFSAAGTNVLLVKLTYWLTP
jgi:hypothetical protein